MQTIVEFAPWVVFFLVYKFGGGIYPATAVLMGSMVLVLAYDWFTTRKIPQMHLILAGMVWVFGAATLILHDVRFLQWKASVFYWIAGTLLAGSALVRKKPLLETMMAKSLPEGTVVPTSAWRTASLLIGVVYLALGTANIWIALHRNVTEWVTFKVWIAPPIAIVATLAAMFWALRDVLFTKDSPT